MLPAAVDPSHCEQVEGGRFPNDMAARETASWIVVGGLSEGMGFLEPFSPRTSQPEGQG